MPDTLFGHTTGLAPLELRALERLYRRKTPTEELASAELVTQLAAISSRIGRQVGVLVDRAGTTTHVVVGDDHGIDLPDIGRARASAGRLRGLRFVHTHLKGEGLTNDDLQDLARLGFDLVAALTLTPDGRPAQVHVGHVVPAREREGARDVRPHEVLAPVAWSLFDMKVATFVRALEVEIARERPPAGIVNARERALLVHVGPESTADAEDILAELAELSRTALVEVVGTVLQRRRQIDPRHVLGEGKLGDVMIDALQREATMVVFSRELTPSQQRSIAKKTELKVIDRTQLILDIFARRARSSDGRIQVELAQLRYRLPRLGERDNALSRLTGGIGGTGPGETKLEIDRRRIRDRIHALEQDLERRARGREVRRRRRDRQNMPVVSLVGYTNVGKSTLLNALTKSAVFTENLLFATLDPTARRLRLPGGTEIILTDTVGFISGLPRELERAFRATLEELRDATLLLHVADAAHPRVEKQIEAVDKLLAELQLADAPRLVVLNKLDRLHDPPTLAALQRQRDALGLSAKTREGLGDLMARMELDVGRALEAEAKRDTEARQAEREAADGEFEPWQPELKN